MRLLFSPKLHSALISRLDSWPRIVRYKSSLPFVGQPPKPIDFRSDTVTTPTREMLEFALAAKVGDDVYGEDNAVNDLQDYVASICGKESALFIVTATMSNQAAVASNLHLASIRNTHVVIHEVICDRRAHIYARENGGIAHLSKAQANPLCPFDPLSPLTASLIHENLHLKLDFHQPLSTLIGSVYCYFQS
eukprot:Sdes_comp18206_c0_seq1m7758